MPVVEDFYLYPHDEAEGLFITIEGNSELWFKLRGVIMTLLKMVGTVKV